MPVNSNRDLLVALFFADQDKPMILIKTPFQTIRCGIASFPGNLFSFTLLSILLKILVSFEMLRFLRKMVSIK